MSDDKTKRGSPDKDLISLNQRWEVRYWTKELGVSLTTLRYAVGEVGNSVDKVRQFLADGSNEEE